MKEWGLYMFLSVLEGFANLAIIIFSACIVIALYKTTQGMQVEDLIYAVYVLASNAIVIKLLVMLFISICIRAVCFKLNRKSAK